MAVVFDVSKSLYSLRDQPATILAEDLRRTAAGQLGKYGVEGARAAADAIEQALVGDRRPDPSRRRRSRGSRLFPSPEAPALTRIDRRVGCPLFGYVPVEKRHLALGGCVGDHLRAPYGRRSEHRLGTAGLLELDRSRSSLLTEGIPWQAMSPAAREIAATIGNMVAWGWTHAEIATFFGKSLGWVSDRVRTLRRELERLAETSR